MRDAGIRPMRRPQALGCAVGTGMMGMEFAICFTCTTDSAPGGTPTHIASWRIVALDPMVFCRSRAPAGLSPLLAPIRHQRLFHVGPYRLCIRRSSDRHLMKLIRRGTVDYASRVFRFDDHRSAWPGLFAQCRLAGQ
jgi:hypothetical protein